MKGKQSCPLDRLHEMAFEYHTLDFLCRRHCTLDVCVGQNYLELYSEPDPCGDDDDSRQELPF